VVAKGRKYKCPVCGIYDHEDSMVVEKIGGQKNGYTRLIVIVNMRGRKNLKRNEREELDELVEVIKETHSIGVHP